MRVAITHNLPSGGAKRTLAESVQQMAARPQADLRFEVFTLSSAEHAFGDLRPHVDAYHITPFEPLRLLRSPFGRLNQLLRRIDLQRLDRIYARQAAQIDAMGFDMAYVQPCRFEGAPSLLSHLSIPTVYYAHEPPRHLYEQQPPRPYAPQRSGLRQALDRLDPLPGMFFNAQKANDQANTLAAGQVLVNSHFSNYSISRIYQRPVQTVYLGIDSEFFQPNGQPKADFVLAVGSLTPLKGFDFIIESLADIPAGQRPRLVIACNFQNPPERAYLLDLAQSKGVQVDLRGMVSDEDLRDLYNQALLTIYTPLREPFGLVPLESMACGTPVVGVRDGGIPETVVDGETGLLCDRRPEECAAAIQALLSDARLRQRMGQNGIQRARSHWDWDATLPVMINALRRAGGLPALEDAVTARNPVKEH